ncbi:MAG: Ig-like domain-containing protein [Nocardioidaceae bacterium]|nr:Ig-like domain-containing protein [Nocardioidaceae bacterium]
MRGLLAAVLLLAGLTWPASTAEAQPLPAPYSGSTDNNVVGLNANLFGLAVNADVAHDDQSVDSTATPASTAYAANVGAGAVGIGVGVSSVSQTAPPDNPTPTTGDLVQADVTGLLDTGVTTGTANARWAGTGSCSPSGQAIASSQAQVASLTLGNAAVQVMQLGAASTTGTTSLTSNGGTGDARSVVGTSTGSIASLTLLNGLISVNVAGDPTLTATASGTPGGATVSYNAATVTVTAPAPVGTVTLQPGVALPITIPAVGTVTLTLGQPTNVTTSANGQDASGDVSLLSVGVSLLGGLGTANVDLLPLHAEAHAPSGGVQCGVLATPTISTPAEGSTTQDTTPAITGTGVPGATVTVVEGGTTIGTATVANDGSWTVTPSSPMSLGSHTITASQALGSASSDTTAPRTFSIVDTTAPDPPVISSPADGSVTNDPTPTITGTAEPGSTVDVTLDGTDLGTVQAAPDGSWSMPVTTTLSDGSHTVSATATDASGNTSTAATSTFTVDTTVVPPTITSPADGSVTNDTTPAITGKAEPGATVAVSVDGTLVGTTTADPTTGAWSITPTTALGEGQHTVSAVQTDPAGNVSDPATSTFTVDTTPPAAPVIKSPADGSSTNDATPTISGTAEAGSTVHVTIDGTPVGTTTAGPDGTWSLDTTSTLSDGSHTVGATAGDAAGNISPATSNTFTVDTHAPAAPVIQGPADGSTVGTSSPTVTGTAEPGSKVTVVVDGTTYTTTADPTSGQWSVATSGLPDGHIDVTATATDAAGNTSPTATSSFTVDTTAAAPVITSPDPGTVTNDPTVTLTGTAEPNATVTIKDENGNVVATTTADASGGWTATTDPLAEGPHSLTASQVDPTGNQSASSSPLPITIDTTALPPVITSPADGGTTGDPTPTIKGTGEPGATVTVDIDGNPAGTATVGNDGTWSFTPTTPLGDGSHTVTATQTDPAGNTSKPSDPVTFTVDTTAPAAPTISSPHPGQVLHDPTPVIRGTGQPGATVTVVVDGHTLGTAKVGPNGTWQLPVRRPLAPGHHVVTATQTDAAGNVSPATHVPFSVGVRAPATPTVRSPGTTTDTTPAFSGTGTPGSKVDVIVDGAVLGTALVGPGGRWHLTPTQPLACGRHSLAAQARRGGAASALSPTQHFTIRCSTGAGGPHAIPAGVGPAAVGPAGLLPNTGAPAGLLGLTLLGLVLLATGARLVRRRRT